ncbi:flagellar hook-basal body complex protein FliE [Hahella sp. SMD15-11]|uniref:Flagellar hook-basal body complex protein FliE n=1 Tax=Thermohahella caldifontis TaxID=3142973 RepID=A0AB39UXC8_9GAMM
MTTRVDVNDVLAQIRAARARIQRPAQAEQAVRSTVVPPAAGDARAAEKPGFAQMLQQAVNQVDSVQKNASSLATAYEKGDPNVDLTQVMIASQKASVAFQAMTQVRNRVVQAYEDIMKMPI